MSVGSGLRFDLIRWLSLSLGVSGGYFYSMLNNDLSVAGGSRFLSADARAVLLPGPLRFMVGASFRYLFGLLYSGLSAYFGLSYEFAPAAAAAPTQANIQEKPLAKAVPLQEQPLNEQLIEKRKPSVELKDLALEDIFPAIRTYYDNHPLGKVVLSNMLDQPITAISVSFQVKQFMDDPENCPSPFELKPGESKEVELFGLFRPNILETTEATKAQARVDLEYTLNGQIQHQSLIQTIRILDRNAITWTDNRRAAAFVTTKDPAVLTFSKNVHSIVKGKVRGSINASLLAAMAFHETLHLYGLAYSQDPIPTLTTNNQVADYIQFPRHTLEYKGGKCSDFSVLYSALLESVGIETAFITIPGHILLAFSLELSPDEARQTFSHPDDLIFQSDKSWIPLEVTESVGFLQAWQDGAKEWRENLRENQAVFYPLHEAWRLYEPVGLPGERAIVNLPPSEKIVEMYQKESARFVEQEVSTKGAIIQAEMREAQDQTKLTNDLGVLYAKYGLYDQAKQEFEKLLEKEEYVPALVNIGNVFYLNDGKEKALDYYNRAYAKDPKNPRVLLAVAKASHDLENYYLAKKAYAELLALDPNLALRFAYLALKGEEATRSAEISGVAGVVVWEE